MYISAFGLKLEQPFLNSISTLKKTSHSHLKKTFLTLNSRQLYQYHSAISAKGAHKKYQSGKFKKKSSDSFLQ